MATYDILHLRVELLESLHISNIDDRSDRGNAILQNVPEIIVNCLKMQSHLVLLVGVVGPIEDGARIGDFNYPCSRHS